MRRSIIYGFLVQLFFLGSLYAQSDRGAITGTVSDSSGAVIPAVQVTATNLDTKVQTTVTSNDLGLYTILNLPVGRYSVTFTKTGFKTHERTGIVLGVAQVASLDIVLAVGAITENVTVTAQAGILETQQPQVGTSLKSGVLTDLPLNVSGGRLMETFAFAITPAVEGNEWTSYIAGGQSFSKEVLIDGTSHIVQIGGHAMETSPTVEAVEEFKVETSGIRAEDGRSGGGVFKFNLKSGTNDFHGSAFGFLHNEMLNANTWINNHDRAYYTANPSEYQQNFGKPFDPNEYRKPFDRQFVYGFSAGGPIIKNRTFIFGAFEKYMQQRYALGDFHTTVPIPAFLDGDFSALLDTGTTLGTDAGANPVYKGAIFDPGTGLVFPGNIIPSNRISAVSQTVADIYRTSYKPMRSGLSDNSAIVRQNDPWYHQNQFVIKADHNLSAANHLTGSIIWTERPRVLVDQGGVWDPDDPDQTGGPFSKARKQKVSGRSLRLHNSYSISSNLLNVASFTFGRYRNPSTATAAEQGNWPQLMGLGDTGANHFPEIDFGAGVNGVGTDPIGYSSSGYYVSNVYIANEALTWVKGRHTAKFGGEMRFFQMNSHGGLPTLGFDFSHDQTGAPTQPWASQVGFGFASFLLGEVESASQATPFDLYGRRRTYTLFVQDDWKVNERLTVALDLRWEAASPFKEKYGHWANFNQEATNPAIGIPGVLEFAQSPDDSFETERDWKEFAPHIGVAYKVSNRAVIRGAWGMFYSPIGLNYWSGVPYGYAPGYQGTNQVPVTGNFSPAFNWDHGYPGQFVPGTTDPNQYVDWYTHINPRSLFAGRIHQWNVGVELELSDNTRLDVTYMANKAGRLQGSGLERNQPDMQAFSQLVSAGNEWNWVWDEASAAASGVPYPHQGFSNFAFFALLPFPQASGASWGPIFSVGSPLGSSDYQSLQIALSRRSAKGLAANLAYTLSRNRGNVQDTEYGAFQETWWAGPLQDVNNLDAEANTLLGTDQRHVFKGYASYDLPFGRGRKYLTNSNGVTNALLGGWTLSSSFRYATGLPMSVASSYYYWGWAGMDWNYNQSRVYSNVNMNGDFSSRFDGASYNPLATGPTPGNQYFDPGNFSNPNWGEFGTGPLFFSDFRGFGQAQESIGLLKNFRFGTDGRFRLQFRFELYNMFNRHYFSDPETDIASPLFGQVTSTTGSPRQGQFGARFEW